MPAANLRIPLLVGPVLRLHSFFAFRTSTALSQRPSARTGKQEAARPGTASTAAEGSRTTAAAAVEEPVAAAVAPEANSAEEAAARAATVPEEVDTAIRRPVQIRLPHSPRYGSKNCLPGFFYWFCVSVILKIVTLQCIQSWKQYTSVFF